MANPQTENGYTVICNEILEAISKVKLNGTQFRIVMVVWRSTYGWNKKEHDISETFLANATGIHKKQINREMKGLIEKKIIIVVKESTRSQSRVLKFNKNYDEWELISRVVTKTLGGNELVDSCGNELVDSCGNENVPQKRNTKNNIKNNVHIDFFEKMWALYPNKKGKGKISETKKKELYKYGEEVIVKCIQRYKETKENWKAWQNGDTFFRTNYIDYLDENYQEKPDVQNNGRYEEMDIFSDD